jgi:hypothetical protein
MFPYQEQGWLLMTAVMHLSAFVICWQDDGWHEGTLVDVSQWQSWLRKLVQLDS